MGVFQTLLETTADDLLEIFKANCQASQRSDDKVRGDILRGLHVIKEALVKPKQPSQSLAKESILNPAEAKHSEPGPSISAPNVIDLTADSDSESVVSQQSPKVGQKRSREDSHLSSPSTKRVCSSASTPMRNSKTSAYFNTTAGSSSANSKNADDAASINISVAHTSQQHTISKSQNLSLNSITKTTASGNMSANVCGSSQERQKELIPSASSGLASPSGQSSFSDESSATFTSLKRSSSKARSTSDKSGWLQKSKSNQEPSNVPDKRSTPESIQRAETVTSKFDESLNDLQHTSNTTNSEKSIAGPSHKTVGSGVLSEKAPTSELEASDFTKQSFDSQGSTTSKRTKKRFKQSHLAGHDQKQSEAGTGHDLVLSLLNPTEGEVTGGKGPSRESINPKQPRRKGTHSTSQESSSTDRKRGSRCPKSKRHRCPVCSKPDCGKCKNCLNKGKHQACLEKPITECVTYIDQNALKMTPKNDSEVPSAPDKSILKRQRSRSSSSEDTPLLKKRKVEYSSNFSSSEDDVYTYSSPAPNQAQLQINSSSSDTESDSESESELPSATSGPSTQKESDSDINTHPSDLSNSSISLGDSQHAEPDKDFLDEALMDTEVEICAAKCGVFGPPGTGKSHFKAILSGKKRPTGGRQSTALATEADQIIPIVDIKSEFDDEFLEMHTITTQSRDGSNIKWYVTNNKKLDGLVAKTLYKEKRPDSSIVIHERPVSNRGLRRRVLKQLRQLIQKNPKLSKLKCLKGMRLIYIVDTGGQPQFQEIMPMFVRSSSIHFLVHKLNEPLDDCPRFDYEISGIKYTVPDKMLVSNRTYIEQSLRTISSCIFARNSGRYTCGSNPKPHFGIIGMFKDKCRDAAILDKKRSEVNKCIQPYVVTKPRKCEAFTPSRHNEKPIFSIDGSEEGWSSNGNVIDDLHTNIENFTKSVKIRVPVRWFLFLNLLKEQKNRPFMSLQECEDMAKKENIMMNEKDDIIEALELFDELNLVLYFSKFLPSVVFISPAFLLNKVSEIIVQSFDCDAPNTGISSEDRMQFRMTGIFEQSMIQKVKSLQQGLDDTFSQDHLFELLKQLCIIADITDNRFFIPCVLALEHDDVNFQFLKSIIDHMHTANIEPLMISFPDGYSPRGLFCASIAFLAKLPNWSLESTSSTRTRRRNLIEFEVSEVIQQGQKVLPFVPLGTVVIVDRMSHIEVYSTCARKFLCNIRRNINEALWYAAAKCLAYSPTSMKVSIGFSCAIDCGYPETHGTAVQDKDDPNWSMKCLKNSRKRAAKLNDRQLPWFTTPASDVMSAANVGSVPTGSEPTLALLMDEVATENNKWEMIALHLDIDQAFIERIDRQRRGDIQDCFHDVFSKWQKQRKRPFTWSVIIDALSSPSVGETALADGLRKKYLS